MHNLCAQLKAVALPSVLRNLLGAPKFSGVTTFCSGVLASVLQRIRLGLGIVAGLAIIQLALIPERFFAIEIS